jgi:asparagine synthase (glutamine-hydrolysing)
MATTATKLEQWWFGVVYRAEAALIQGIRERRLTYCSYPKLENIARAMREVRRRGVAGAYVEAGVALGGSAILLARCKPSAARLLLFDVFGMIPPPSERDGEDAHRRYREIASGASKGIGEDRYYGYEANLERVVAENLRANGVELERDRVALVPGLFQDTMAIDEPVAFAHIDCDWYDSVRTCIDRIGPRLAAGGMMVFDDYGSYSGCRRAVDELLAADRSYSVVRVARSITLRKA